MDTPAEAGGSIWSEPDSGHAAVSRDGYRPAYVSPPPPASTSIDEFDPFAPSRSPPKHGNLLGSGIRTNSKLVLIDSSDSDDDHDHHDHHEPATQPAVPSSSFNFVGSMFKTLSSAATSPSTSRPSTPLASPPPTTTTRASTSSSPLPKPFASIASVFRSSPVPAGKGKQKQDHLDNDNDDDNEKSVPPPAPVRSRPPHRRRRRRRRRARPRQVHRRPDPTFDFTRFLEQMRSRQADPIAKYLRSFLKEFSRRPPQSATDQQRVVNDFLAFIGDKMRNADPWKTIYLEEVERGGGGSLENDDDDEDDNDDDDRDDVREEDDDEERDRRAEDEDEVENDDDDNDEGEGERDPELSGVDRAEVEFELSLEAMEKLVMNRLWHLTFTPAAVHEGGPLVASGGMSSSGDLERDQVVRQRIRLFGWIEPKHLDLPPSVDRRSGSSSEDSSDGEQGSGQVTPEAEQATATGDTRDDKSNRPKTKKGSERGFIDFAASELRKMNQYKAPRDKLICVLNCCKVIFGLIRHVANSVQDQGADTFIPFLIYVVLQANPDHLVSNLQYIQRFRNPEKLAGEGGYYLSSLNAAISFIETLDASALSNIDQAEFEQNVAAAVKLLASEEPPPPPPPRPESSTAAPAIGGGGGSSPSRRRPPMAASSDTTSSSLNLVDPIAPTDETSSASLLDVAARRCESQASSSSSSSRNLLLRGSDSVERAMSRPIGALARIFEQLELTANELTGQTTTTTTSTTTTTTTPTRMPTFDNSAPGQEAAASAAARPRNPPPPPPHGRSSYVVAPPRSFSSSSSSSSRRRKGGGAAGEPANPDPDPALYADPDVSDAKISEVIERRERDSHEAKMETLMELFAATPSSREGGGGGGGIEREVVEMVLWAEGGDVGRAVERLLEMG